MLSGSLRFLRRLLRARRPVPRTTTAALAVSVLALVGTAMADDTAPAERPPLHDPAAADAAGLQRPADALTGLPLDKRGKVDWMKALRDARIQPRADLRGEKPMDVLDLDVVMKNTAEMPHVKFPHSSHTQWLACSNCHDQIFVPKAGANPITMTKIFRGEYCGLCHDRVAFTTLYACERCHSLLHGDGKAWW